MISGANPVTLRQNVRCACEIVTKAADRSLIWHASWCGLESTESTAVHTYSVRQLSLHAEKEFNRLRDRKFAPSGKRSEIRISLGSCNGSPIQDVEELLESLQKAGRDVRPEVIMNAWEQTRQKPMSAARNGCCSIEFTDLYDHWRLAFRYYVPDYRTLLIRSCHRPAPKATTCALLPTKFRKRLTDQTSTGFDSTDLFKRL